MARKDLTLCGIGLTLLLTGLVHAGDSNLQAMADGDHRSADYKARNVYRHPVETLEFFGIRDDLVVVEISPGGGGWYTEILAPYLREAGRYIAGSYDLESSSAYYRENAGRFNAKMAAQPELYDAAIIGVFAPPDMIDTVPEGTADMVVTFRNLHNWVKRGSDRAALEGMYRMLKPGGVLGLVEHRGDPATPQDPTAKSGYVNEDYAIALAESVGFELLASSEINANPADTKDHPEGVWTLPPGYRLGDVDREKYAAIGESDRMTLRFVKPDSVVDGSP